MISHLRIRDFAIIENLDVEFNTGLNIITGETGAGKSIIIEAVSLALGSRADTAYVRTGKDKALIQLIINSADEEYILTREISATGKSICKVNDEIVTLAHLNKLCKKLADIHGQYDHQSLLNPDNHINFLDDFNSEILPLKEEVQSAYEEYITAKSNLNDLVKNAAERERKRDFMAFELSEIEQANLTVKEDEILSDKISLLQNGEKIYQNLTYSYDLLYSQTPSSVDCLSKSLKFLEEIADFSTELSSMKEILSDCYYKIEDLSGDLRNLRDSITFSQEELDQSISRLDAIENLKRKYKKIMQTHSATEFNDPIEEILNYKEYLAEELLKIDDLDYIKKELTDLVNSSEKALSALCEKLTERRRISAENMEKMVNHELNELNFNNTLFSVKFADVLNKDKRIYSANGTDKIEFLITTNKGEAPKPLSKIASGGEISRIMLAFKRIIGDYDMIPTMIFDEIDSGISGITATIVGKKLKEIAEKHQIICITHLPQIAAYGDYHYRIQKSSDENSTKTTVVELDESERVNEIARLLGGLNITENTLKSAAELVKMSKI